MKSSRHSDVECIEDDKQKGIEDDKQKCIESYIIQIISINVSYAAKK